MNENELHERLIDYVEGNISPEQKTEIEAFLTKSPQMQNEFDLIQSALTELSSISDEDVPNHYFSNFLPRLRDRLESGKVHLPMFIPEWYRLFSAPLIVSAIVLSIIIMYQTFNPEQIHSSIYSLVNDMERSEMNYIVDESSDFVLSSKNTRNADILFSDVSSVRIIESKLTEDLLVLDVSSYQSEHELISNLGDKEIEQVLDRLDKPNVQ